MEFLRVYDYHLYHETCFHRKVQKSTNKTFHDILFAKKGPKIDIAVVPGESDA